MLTVVLEKPGVLSAVQTPQPGAPSPGMARVRVRRVGICGTDLHAYRGRQPFFDYPRILGHELGVEVDAVGAGVVGFEEGMRCAVEPYLPCGACHACARGLSNCCEHLQVLGVHTDGGMRQWLEVPASTLHPSDHLALEQLALVETLGIGAHAVERARLVPGEGVLIVGAGPIGLSVLQFASLAGVKVAVLEVNEQRLAFCRENFALAAGIVANETNLDSIRAAFDGNLPTAVFDATGNRASMHAAFEYPAAGGRLVCVGFQRQSLEFANPELHRRELSIIASRNSVSADFKRIIRLIEDGSIDTQPWITHRAQGSEVVDRFESWLDPEAGVVKAVVDF